MIITRHDRPIGKARAGGITIMDDTPARADCPYTLKASDTHQMTWNQLCRATGRRSSTFWYRVNRYGMTPLQALTSPAEPYQHVVMSVADLCRLTGIDRRTFNSRRRLGWSFRAALLTPSAGRGTTQEAA
jgi:hypothetical protein